MTHCSKNLLYICIEGLDGAGKSTVFNYLIEYFKQKHIPFSTVCPTKSLNSNHIIERIFKKSKILNNSRCARAILYAHRSNQASRAVDWHSGLILGDRSLITSYVVRWGNCKLLNSIVIFLVNMMERQIKSPHHVIYINVSPKVLEKRLNIRETEADIDENKLRSAQMKKAYFYFMTNKNAIKRISHVNWHVICGDGNVEDVNARILKVISKILNKSKYRSC